MSDANTQLLVSHWPTRKRSGAARPRKDVTMLVISEMGKDRQVQVGIEEIAEQHLPAPYQQIQAVRKGRSSKRCVVQSSNSCIPAEAPVQNEYELQRAERIKRNQAMLRALNISQLAADLRAACTSTGAASDRAPAAKGSAMPRPAPAKRQPAAALVPTRKSARRGGAQDGTAHAQEGGAEGGVLAEIDENAATLSQEQYLKEVGISLEGAVQSDGHFHGWVNPETCERYGVAGNAADAWETNGGGKFTFKIDRSAIPSSLKSRGWSDARAWSSTQLQKNPNTFFYRHVAPHECQAQGEWTQEEHDLFLQTAQQHGVGDKWGLFASYIPQRVGYQCSAYYREVIIPSGLILDSRFRMTHSGKAIFVG